MHDKPLSFTYLVDALSSLPSVGNKVARRIAYFLLRQDERYIQEFVYRILNAKQQITYCKQCNNFSDGNDLCSICNNFCRDQQSLCIVNDIEELEKIEETQTFSGLYFVLNQEIHVAKKQLLPDEICIQLRGFLEKKQFKNVLLATNLTPNGQATALFLKRMILEILPDAKIYRLAIGLPINSCLEYADTFTIESAIKNKIKF